MFDGFGTPAGGLEEDLGPDRVGQNARYLLSDRTRGGVDGRHCVRRSDLTAAGPLGVHRQFDEFPSGLDLTQNYKIKLLDGAPLRTKLRTLMVLKFR